MRKLRWLLLSAALSLAGCANAHERLADALTRAIVRNDLTPVMGTLSPEIEGEITRVRVAEFSDEMASSGTYRGLRETHAGWCPADSLCFDLEFSKGRYREILRLASDGKVRYLWIRPVPA
jgi:hypothetical protein